MTMNPFFYVHVSLKATVAGNAVCVAAGPFDLNLPLVYCQKKNPWEEKVFALEEKKNAAEKEGKKAGKKKTEHRGEDHWSVKSVQLSPTLLSL